MGREMADGQGVGLGVGTTWAVAVLQAADAPLTDPSVLVEPATLRLSDTAAELGAPEDEPGVLAGFVAHVGDPAGVATADGAAYRAEDLVATATAGLLATAVDRFPGLPDDPGVAAAHPARWDDATVSALRAAYDRAGLEPVTLVPDAVAAVAWLEAAHGPVGDGLVAVYDLGAAGVTVSLVRTGSRPDLLRPATFSTLFGGDSLDDMVVEHVLVSAAPDLGLLDPTDPTTRAELDRLRARCRDVKEQLSSTDAVTVPVTAAGADTAVTVTRAELEEMLRGPLAGSLSLVEETVRAHELDPAQLRSVLLTGGGAAIPMLAELAATLPVPVVAAPDPNRIAVHGAAILAAHGGAVPVAGSAAAAGAAPVAERDTDSLPAVPAPATPTAFTEAGPGRPVHAPTPPPGPRGRVPLVAAGIAVALVVAAVAGAAAMSRSEDTGGRPLPQSEPTTTATVDPAPTSRAATSTTRASAPATDPDTGPATSQQPVRTTVATTAAPAPPPAVTTQRPPVLPTTTTRVVATTEESPTTTTSETTTTTTTTEPTPTPTPEDATTP
ncbi:hypothetical protein GCM10023094_40160 [Rhodococcus olei]|uniref:Hsp70 protein n=1 Tax=Rhodococcus olei TaxID=2161675 RepID=A0ABP8PER1_9NOCA